MSDVVDRPWMCAGCGYMMNRATCITDPAVTEITDGDSLSLCLNCAAVYERRSGKWVLMTVAERADLPNDTKLVLLKAKIAQGLVIKNDLAARDKWA